MQNTIADLKMGGNASAALTDKRTGAIWTCKAGPVARCWNVAEERLREIPADRMCVERADEPFGYTLTFTAPDEGISFAVKYSLRESVLEVCVPISSVKEMNSSFRLLSIMPLPGFGSVKTGEPGYMLLPNYSGVICRFDKELSLVNGDMVYMHQSQWEHFTDLPVFGICHGSSALFGIVSSGEFDTEIVTELNAPGRQNCIFPRMHFRYGKADEIDNIDRQVRYHLLSGEDADYAGMARTYRKYLLEERGLRPLKERLPENPILSDYDSYSFVKIFCAAKSPHPEGKGALHVATTFAEAEEILRAMKASGIERASVILVGWNLEGHDGMYPTRLPVEPALGGEEGLRRLVESSKNLGYRITFHDNYADAYRISPDFDDADTMIDQDGWPVCCGAWSGGPSYIMCPHRMLKFAERDLPRTKALGLDGRCYLDGMVQPPRICRDARHGHPATRRAYGEGIRAIVDYGRRAFGSCEIENATDFVSDLIDGIAQVIVYKQPVARETEFARYFMDEFVPFYQIAYHGIVQYRLVCPQNYENAYGSVDAGLLKEIELGAMPRIEFCYRRIDEIGHPSYTEYLPLMKRQYDILCKELGHLQLEFMDDHRSIAPGVYKTSYSNGTEVIVNYGKAVFEHGAYTVAPESYLVLE